MEKILTYAVIKDGVCVFGAGDTESAALEDALDWLGPRDNGDAYTIETLREECAKARSVGDLRLIARDDNADEFDSYVRNQGAYVKSSRGKKLAAADGFRGFRRAFFWPHERNVP